MIILRISITYFTKEERLWEIIQLLKMYTKMWWTEQGSKLILLISNFKSLLSNIRSLEAEEGFGKCYLKKIIFNFQLLVQGTHKTEVTFWFFPRKRSSSSSLSGIAGYHNQLATVNLLIVFSFLFLFIKGPLL